MTAPVRRAAGTEHDQHRADAAGGAVRPGAVDAVELADREAARADLGEQALRAGVRRVGRVGQRVDDVLRAEVAGPGRGRVVAVAGGGGPRLEVLRQRVALGVGERLPDQRAADGRAAGGDERAVGLVA